MPLYDYACDTCGDFRDWRAMCDSEDPADCPTCARPARRRVTAPFIAFMPVHTRIAHERNEKSAHEPKVMTRQQLDRQGGSCGIGHAHGHGHRHGPAGPVRGPEQNLQRSPKRWMVGH